MLDQVFGSAKRWSVPAKIAGIRLDAFARQCLPHLSRRQLVKSLREKLFFINGKVGKKGDRLKAGDLLTYHGPMDWLQDAPASASHHGLKIAYEDESLLIADKPAGMATHGFSARDQNTLANLLVAHRPALTSIGNSRWQPGLVHRLDRDTSGLVLVAKTQPAFEHLRLQFRRRQVEKRYWALVWGSTALEGEIAYPLMHEPGSKGRMQPLVDGSGPGPRPKAWTALTHYRKLAGGRRLSLLEVRMNTGVTHQIRVHLAVIGHPIVGDSVYGAARQQRLGLKRHFLHAVSLQFRHPDDEQLVKVESRLPAELTAVLDRLRIAT